MSRITNGFMVVFLIALLIWIGYMSPRLRPLMIVVALVAAYFVTEVTRRK